MRTEGQATEGLVLETITMTDIEETTRVSWVASYICRCQSRSAVKQQELR